MGSTPAANYNKSQLAAASSSTSFERTNSSNSHSSTLSGTSTSKILSDLENVGDDTIDHDKVIDFDEDIDVDALLGDVDYEASNQISRKRPRSPSSSSNSSESQNARKKQRLPSISSTAYQSTVDDGFDDFPPPSSPPEVPTSPSFVNPLPVPQVNFGNSSSSTTLLLDERGKESLIQELLSRLGHRGQPLASPPLHTSQSFQHSAPSPSQFSFAAPTRTPASLSSSSMEMASAPSSVVTNLSHSSQSCQQCADLFQQYQSHLASGRIAVVVEVVKRWVAAWFNASFEFVVDNEDGSTSASAGRPEPQMVLVFNRGTFLQQEINPFLTRLGFTAWNAKTKLYREWFLREFLGQTETQTRLAKPFRLLRKVSEVQALQRLRQLLDY
ncbi:MAG: hypothetical protein Q8M03_01100 [Legionella sp.]|nr:hypothetical protein [Legionella sp.]